MFVHCDEGCDRTGYTVAAYPVVVESWPVDDVLHEMFGFRFDAIWFRNPVFLRKLDVALISQWVQRAPQVAARSWPMPRCRAIGTKG